MVSSGAVQGDLSSISSSLSSYSSEMGSLGSSWKGPSYDSLSAKAEEFVSEYTSVLEGEMNAFATACDLYIQYKNAKDNLKIAEENYQEAVSRGTPAEVSKFQSDINTYKSRMESLRGQIESSLASASSTTLTATSFSGFSGAAGGSYSGGAGGSGGAIGSAIDWAIGIANDDSHGYSQSTRYGNPNYDCSSLVIYAWDAAGVPVREKGADYTGNMREAFLDTGQFEWIPGCPDASTMTAGDGTPFQPGDVFLAEGHHTEMYVGNGMSVGAHDNFDGSNGDSSGNEIDVHDYTNGRTSWDGILRYKGEVSV